MPMQISTLLLAIALLLAAASADRSLRGWAFNCGGQPVGFTDSTLECANGLGGTMQVGSSPVVQPRT